MFVVFDLETTGFSEMTNDIIQFAYIMFDNNNMFVKAETLYYYYEGMSWSDEAYKVHKISLDFLREHKDEFRANLIKMYSVLNHANVVGHNSERFDCPFVRNWLRRMGISGLEFGIRYDTMLAYKPVTKRSRIKLTKLCDIMNITPEYVNAMSKVWFENESELAHHDAAYDTTATALLTLRGIEKNLISFTVNTNAVVSEESSNSSIDMDSMLANDETRATDPNRYIVELKQDGDAFYVFVNHNKDLYADTVPAGLDVLTADYNNLCFPKIFEQSVDSSNKFVCEHAGVIYEFTQGEKKDSMLIKTPYGEFTDEDVNISLIIKNNFKGGE